MQRFPFLDSEQLILVTCLQVVARGNNVWDACWLSPILFWWSSDNMQKGLLAMSRIIRCLICFDIIWLFFKMWYALHYCIIVEFGVCLICHVACLWHVCQCYLYLDFASFTSSFVEFKNQFVDTWERNKFYPCEVNSMGTLNFFFSRLSS